MNVCNWAKGLISWLLWVHGLIFSKFSRRKQIQDFIWRVEEIFVSTSPWAWLTTICQRPVVVKVVDLNSAASEQLCPVYSVVVTEVGVLTDVHTAITDLPEGAQAQWGQSGDMHHHQRKSSVVLRIEDTDDNRGKRLFKFVWENVWNKCQNDNKSLCALVFGWCGLHWNTHTVLYTHIHTLSHTEKHKNLSYAFSSHTHVYSI